MELMQPLLANVALVTPLWLYCLWRRDASLIDLVWPLLFVLAAWLWFDPAVAGWRQWAVLLLVMVWGARLHIHLARRNLGHGEDRRYGRLRAAYSPGFWWKSFFLVFLLQAFLAWLAALVIFGALNTVHGTWWLPLPGLALMVFGLGFESVADWQLDAFKNDPANAGRVLDSGLWRLSRHPNYFGECCFWWGVFILAAPGHGWTVVSPLLMTFLLVRVSGVAMLEREIGERRPAYRNYIRTTPAFIPDFGKLLRAKPC